MEFFTAGEAEVGFRNIHPLLADLVRAIPEPLASDRITPATEARLFPNPTDAADLEDLRADWNAFVTPGLQNHFQSARDIVSADLRRFADAGEGADLMIPLKHADAWLNVLNQVRLALAASISFDEAALESSEMPDLLSDRGLIVFRINLYAFMQQCLVDQLDQLSAAVEKTRAILIRRIRFSETSLICVWVTEACGKIRTSARGALKPGGAFQGKLDLFYTAEIAFGRSRQGDLHALREVMLIAPFDGEGTRYGNLTVAAYFADLADLVTEPMAHSAEIYDLFSRAVTYLRTSRPDLRTIPHFETQLCRALGIHQESGRADSLRALAAHCGRIPASRARAIQASIPPAPPLAPPPPGDKM